MKKNFAKKNYNICQYNHAIAMLHFTSPFAVSNWRGDEKTDKCQSQDFNCTCVFPLEKYLSVKLHTYVTERWILLQYLTLSSFSERVSRQNVAVVGYQPFQAVLIILMLCLVQLPSTETDLARRYTHSHYGLYLFCSSIQLCHQLKGKICNWF
jgi:hypothetical protein